MKVTIRFIIGDRSTFGLPLDDRVKCFSEPPINSLEADLDRSYICMPYVRGMRAMRITSKGQVSIPIGIRQRASLFPNTVVEFAIEDGKVVLKPADGLNRRERMVERLRAARTIDLGMSVDEYMEQTRGPFDDVEAPPALNETTRRS